MTSQPNWRELAQAGHVGDEATARAALTDADPVARERIRANVAARINGYTYEQTTTGLLAALGSIPIRARA